MGTGMGMEMGNGEGLTTGPGPGGASGGASGFGGPPPSGSVGPEPAAAPSWQAPSHIERELYEAKTRGDWPGYFDVLGRNWLYAAESRAFVDAHPDRMKLLPHFSPQVGAQCLALVTEGMLPVPTQDPVYTSGSLGWFARQWKEHDPPWIVINPGSPCEAYFPTTPGHRAQWLRHALPPEDGFRLRGRLRALHVGGPLHGPVAHGLACGALLFVNNGEFWNAVGYHGGGYQRERNRLQEWWGIDTRADWQRTLERLLRAEMVSPVWEFALQLRRSLALDFAGAVEVDHWRAVAERVVRANAAHAAEPRITPEGVAPGEARPESEVAAQIAGVQRLIGRIARYEARFRADGLLSEGGFIRSVEAWDYGRASCMARWGLGARYCTVAETEDGLLRAGRACRANYRSWEEMSAAYVLGRCLHFDEEEFGDWYENALASHRTLTTDPASPWRNIPWK
ncbi:DUF1266 domain-containing protein [Streptomyces sp. NPDC017979]|uniref:DUF1266 domain-containing protein n=1 Tax=unclassified Streptomyces TaxID=2593676 RepID=UPI0037BAFFB2